MLLSQKYSPKKIDEIAGNDEPKAKIRQWILNWLRGVKQKPLLIHGPTGTGKTAVAYALKGEYDLELIEMNAGDLRNAEAVGRVLSSAASAISLSGKSKLLLIDDVDALGREDRGGPSAIVAALKSSRVPIILTAENIWDKKLAGIRGEALALEFRRISKSSVRKALEKIAEKEKIKITGEALASISENCNGDLRSAINDMQAGMSGMRDREKDIFERMKTIFKSSTYRDARSACEGDVEHDYLKLWVDENIPLEYEKTWDAAAAYNMLSRADVFDGRIMNRQYWGFLRYSNALLTSGIALAKKEKYFKFVRYQFPNYLRQMSASVARRAMLRRIGHKIGERTHAGWKEALDYIHILKHILAKDQLASDFYKFEDEEAAFVLEIPVSEIKEKPALKKGGEKTKTAKPVVQEKKKAPEKKEEGKNESGGKRGNLNDFL